MTLTVVPPVRRGDLRAWPRTFGVMLFAGAIAGVVIGCDNTSHEQEIRGAGRGDVVLLSEGTLARVPVGDWAGATPNTLANTIRNPYEGNPAAVREGRDLYWQMNCADCHGYDLKGGMGPNLRDTYWRYGGAPADLYKTLWEGRPKGMPAWGRALTPDQIWKLVAYIQSYGGTFPPSQANAGKQGDLGDENAAGYSANRGNHAGDEGQ